ncbi:MAG: hypothetical protein ACK5V3_08310 [Bdellovibrionales bacterium]
MRHKIWLVLVLMSFAFSALAAKKNESVIALNKIEISSPAKNNEAIEPLKKNETKLPLSEDKVDSSEKKHKRALASKKTETSKNTETSNKKSQSKGNLETKSTAGKNNTENSTTQTHPQVSNKVLEQWNPTCNGLLDTAVASTIKLEKTLNKKKKKLSQAKFNEKIQDELMVVQLNAWVCAVSSDQTLAASIERAFLQEYAQRVQKN